MSKIKEGKTKGNLKPITNIPKPEIKPAPQKSILDNNMDDHIRKICKEEIDKYFMRKIKR